MRSLNRILVATDYSALGHAAVARAAQIAKRQGAELRIIHATPDWKLFSRFFEARQPHYLSISQHAERALQSEIQWLQQTFALRARGDVNVGNATSTILRVASEFQPDLLIIGARGEHAQTVGPSALGGTALKLIAATQQAVLLVRDPKADPYSEVLLAVKGEAELARRILDWKPLWRRLQLAIWYARTMSLTSRDCGSAALTMPRYGNVWKSHVTVLSARPTWR